MDLDTDALYAVEREDGWHIATWDGQCLNVAYGWQSGDRWTPDQVMRVAKVDVDGEVERWKGMAMSLDQMLNTP